MGKIGDIRAEDALIKLLKDPKPQVRQYTIKALRKIKSRKAVEHLKTKKKFLKIPKKNKNLWGKSWNQYLKDYTGKIDEPKYPTT